MADGTVTIRSFRVCFDLERRIHRIDRWRLPVPYGLPLRSIGYAAVALFAVLFLSRVPVVGAALAALPAPVRLVLVPVGSAYLLTQLKVDGRAAHHALFAFIRHVLEPREVVSFRASAVRGAARVVDVPIARDEGSARYRAGVVEGPAQVTLRYPARARRHRARLIVEQAGARPMWRGKRIALGEGQSLVVR